MKKIDVPNVQINLSNSIEHVAYVGTKTTKKKRDNWRRKMYGHDVRIN